MKALFVLLVACGSSPGTGTGDDVGPVDASPTTHDSPTSTSSGFKLDLGQAYQSSGAVSIVALTKNGVYEGYFQASSDLGSVPNLSVSLSVPNAALSTGMMLSCARSHDQNVFNETSVLIHWLDGDTYYTNVMSTQSCTIHITAASQTSVSADISGTIYDEMDSNLSPHSFTASFVATVH